jgi:hypothetical protein
MPPSLFWRAVIGQQAPAATYARRGFFISISEFALVDSGLFHRFLEPSQQVAWRVGSEIKFNNSIFELYELYELYELDFRGGGGQPSSLSAL